MSDLDKITETLFNELKNKVLNIFDFKTAFAAASFLGTMVFLINYSNGIDEALKAATVEVIKVGLISGFAFALSKNYLGKHEHSNYWLGILLPTLITGAVTYAVHCFGGTSHPLISTLPSVCLSPSGYYIVGNSEKQGITVTQYFKNVYHKIRNYSATKHNL